MFSDFVDIILLDYNIHIFIFHQQQEVLVLYATVSYRQLNFHKSHYSWLT